MQFITREILIQSIQSQDGSQFDTHEVIKGVMRIAPQEYVRELYEYVNTEDPFKPVHGQIGAELSRMTDVVRQLYTKEKSVNIRGQESPAEVWERP
jgi:uncharacterized protein with ATP-grasp and redox domains